MPGKPAEAVTITVDGHRSTALPGTPSLGAALAAGLLLGFTRSAALRLALLFAVASSVTAEVIGLTLNGASSIKSTGPTTVQMLVGTLIAYALALAVIAGFLRYAGRHSLYPFTAYLLVLCGLVVTAVATGVLSAS
ncbi:hypothetical protein GCM10022267_78230 [Lentzea roselyniae]|uniref:Undecaprenyl-diphosphatase n=2 Tax=Lentzea roselyniae TaxID=531940 RepID=A0ABP7C4P9_9PSEU